MPLNREQKIKIAKILALKCLEEEEVRGLKKRRQYWVNPFLSLRDKYDIETRLLKDLLWETNDAEYKNFSRMNVHQFEEILGLVKISITKLDTKFRHAIKPRVRLAITLRFIASGDSYRSLEFLSRISRKTISRFIPEVLEAIYNCLQPTYMKIPTTTIEWLEICKDFYAIWDFPNTLGAIDGKHIRIKAPAHSGSYFYNYKGFFSIILFALVDAHGRFLFIDVGTNGKASDSTIFKNSFLCESLQSNRLNIPQAKPLLGQTISTPYYFIGDDAFPLDVHLLKPFNKNMDLSVAQKAFNYRISRARMTVEMAFGRLANRFRIFQHPIEVLPDVCDKIVKSSCALHNFLTKKIQKAPDCETTSEKITESFSNLSPQSLNTYKNACQIRERVALFCITDGDVPHQWNKINI